MSCSFEIPSEIFDELKAQVEPLGYPFSLTRACQFEIQDTTEESPRETNLIKASDGKQWCRFHLPLTEKASWSKAETKRFKQDISKYIKVPNKNPINLSGVVFHESIDLFQLMNNIVPSEILTCPR